MKRKVDGGNINSRRPRNETGIRPSVILLPGIASDVSFPRRPKNWISLEYTSAQWRV